MQNKILALFLLLFLTTNAQITNRLIVTQNLDSGINPPNLMYTVPPNDNRIYQTNRNNLLLTTSQITGLGTFITDIGNINYKPLTYAPTSAEIISSLGYTPFNPIGTSSQYVAGNGDYVTFPTLFSGSYIDLTNKPLLFSGSYTDLSNKPNLSAVALSGTYSDILGKPTLSSVAVSGSYNDLINQPTIPTNNNQLINGSGFITGITSGQVTTALGFTPYNATNPNGYISTLSFVSLTGKPTTLSGYGITDSYPLTGNPSNFLTSITNSQVVTALGFTPISQASARTAISLTTLGTSGASTYDNTTGIINIPNYTSSTYTAGAGITIASNVISQTTPTYNNTPARALTTSFRPSTTRPTRVSYTASIVTALSLLNLNSSGIVQLQISPDNTNWTTINSAGVTRTLAVSITVGLNETTMINVAGEIPANFYCRLLPTTAGGATVTVSSGQEVTY